MRGWSWRDSAALVLGIAAIAAGMSRLVSGVAAWPVAAGCVVALAYGTYERWQAASEVRDATAISTARTLRQKQDELAVDLTALGRLLNSASLRMLAAKDTDSFDSALKEFFRWKWQCSAIIGRRLSVAEAHKFLNAAVWKPYDERTALDGYGIKPGLSTSQREQAFNTVDQLKQYDLQLNALMQDIPAMDDERLK